MKEFIAKVREYLNMDESVVTDFVIKGYILAYPNVPLEGIADMIRRDSKVQIS